jgi:hypothetical protein
MARTYDILKLVEYTPWPSVAASAQNSSSAAAVRFRTGFTLAEAIMGASRLRSAPADGDVHAGVLKIRPLRFDPRRAAAMPQAAQSQIIRLVCSGNILTPLWP